jgi:hypothetical protein
MLTFGQIFEHESSSVDSAKSLLCFFTIHTAFHSAKRQIILPRMAVDGALKGKKAARFNNDFSVEVTFENLNEDGTIAESEETDINRVRGGGWRL